MSDVELKPCPFCGGKATLVYFDVDDGGKWQVICDDCGACSDYYDEEWNPDNLLKGNEAVESWNRRPIEDALKDKNEHLRKALENIKDELEMFQDKVYDFHFDIDSKSAAYMLDIAKIALGEDND